MKNIITYLLIITAITVKAQAQVETVGELGFSSSAVGYVDVAVNSYTPYVAFVDTSLDNKARVMSYTDDVWQNVGEAVSEGDASFTNLEIYMGLPYVAYVDNNDSGIVKVKKYENGSWVAVGEAVSSSGSLYLCFSVIDNELYVVFSDAEYEGKATVKKWNGTSWELVGAPGFTEEISSYISIQKNDSDRVEVNYFRPNAENVVSGMEFDSSWVVVNNPESDIKNSYEISFDHDVDNFRYVAYQDEDNDYKASVVKFLKPDNLSNDKYYVDGLELYLSTDRAIQVNLDGYHVEVINMYGSAVVNRDLNTGVYIVKATNSEGSIHLVKYLVM